MRTNLLTLVFLLIANLSFSQSFTQAGDNSGLTSNCDLGTETGKYEWQVWGPAGGGGYDESPTDELNIGWGTGSGDIFLILYLTTPLDLSNSANQKIAVTLRNLDGSNAPLPLTYTLRLENSSDVSLLDGSKTFATTGTNQAFNIDFSTAIASGQNLTDVKKIIFYCATVESASHLFVSNLSVGSLVAGIKNAQDLVATSKLYPNPANNTATVELELKSASNVKVVLNDMLGQEVKVITEKYSNSLSETFDVASLHKGIYTISYMIDGVPAKTEKLVVK